MADPIMSRLIPQGTSPEMLDYMQRPGAGGPNPNNMAGLIDSIMPTGWQGLLKQMPRPNGGGGGAGGGAPAARMAPAAPGGGISALAAGRMAGGGGIGGSAVERPGMPAVKPGPVPKGGSGGGQIDSAAGWASDLLNPEAKYPPGMKEFLKDYFKKSRSVLNIKAPNYKGDRVANATQRLDRARNAYNEAGRRILNPDKAYTSAVKKHLDPTQYATGGAQNRYAAPVNIPAPVANAGGGAYGQPTRTPMPPQPELPPGLARPTGY
jgi:hypothetical protein